MARQQFAALEVATGKIIATHSKRRRRIEFLDFMSSITAAFPYRQLHVILDNLNTHKKNEHWLKAHPNVHIYGYLNRVQSSRRLEREAGRNIEVMWLTGRLAPDHKTIADFRTDNGTAIRK